MLAFTYKNNTDEVTVGIDEAGKGCMIGRVYAAAVVWDNTKDPSGIKDSKKISRKNRKLLKEYIETNALAYGVGWATNEEINDMNISNATFLAMHRALDKLNIPFDRILVDGNRFKPYKCHVHNCIIGGDDLFVNIAAASILAKEYHDEWIQNEFADDTKYDLINNKGYGTKKHIEGIKTHGVTPFHRTLYCSKYMTQEYHEVNAFHET
jgi:ribonuclease HII